eukprot:309317_1
MLESSASFGANMHEGSNQEQTPLTLWQEEHKLPDNVINILRKNDVNSLDDLKLFDNDNELKEFVNSLEISFIMKKKLRKTIKALQNDSNCSNESMYKIRWECITNVMTTKQMIQIQSNKLENVEMKTTEQKKKKMLIAKQNLDERGYFEMLCGGIKHEWNIGDVGQKVQVVAQNVLLSPFYAALTMVPILPAMLYSFQYFDNKYEREQFAYKNEHNSVSKIFNDKLKQIEELEKRIIVKMNELQKQEQKLNSHDFELERFGNLNNKSKTIMVIGPTGFGKSLVANRLLGNKKDIDYISNTESKESELIFKVAMSGNTNSVTQKLNKKSKIIHILNGNININKNSFILSVIDTPGAFDSNGNDKNINNLMTHYFKAC